jgi:single-strand DNA-binding protein
MNRFPLILEPNLSVKPIARNKDQRFRRFDPKFGKKVVLTNELQLKTLRLQACLSHLSKIGHMSNQRRIDMINLNKVILIGRLGNDPVRRETKNGTPVTNFSLATSRQVQEEPTELGGEATKREETIWHYIVVWGRQAEVCYQYLRKGRMVYVEGSMRKKNYTGKDGLARVSWEIYADSVGFLGGASSSGTTQDRESEVGEAEIIAEVVAEAAAAAS